jgi:hypothetical protein
MQDERVNLRIFLTSVTVPYNGDIPQSDESEDERSKRDNVFATELKYPRSGIETVVSAKRIALESNVEWKCTHRDFWGNGLFKEDLSWESILNVKVFDLDEPSRLETFIRAVLGIAANSQLSEFVSGLSGVLQGATARHIGGSLVDALSGTEKARKIEIATADPIYIEVSDEHVAFFHKDREGQPASRQTVYCDGEPHMISFLLKPGNAVLQKIQELEELLERDEPTINRHRLPISRKRRIQKIQDNREIALQALKGKQGAVQFTVEARRCPA